MRGAHVTYGKNGTRTTVGLPGSGLSYTSYRKKQRANQAAEQEPETLPKGNAARGWLWIILLALIIWSLLHRSG